MEVENNDTSLSELLDKFNLVCSTNINHEEINLQTNTDDDSLFSKAAKSALNKKKKLNKKLKNINNDQVADLYYQIKYNKDENATVVLTSLALKHRLLAMCYFFVLTFGKLSQEEQSKYMDMVLVLLSKMSIEHKADKYFLFTAGMLQLILQNTILGLHSLKKSACMGYGPAQHQLALNLYLTRHESIKSIEWFKRAADQGIPDAQFDYGRLIVKHYKNYTECFDYFKLAADQGHVEAQFLVAGHYLGEPSIIPVNQLEAVRYMTLAAKRHSTAQVTLSMWYADGVFVSTDLEKCQMYLELAGSKNNSDALRRIGLGYLFAIWGFTKDVEKGMEYVLMADSQIDSAAQI